MIINENKLDRKNKPKEKKDYLQLQLEKVIQQKKKKEQQYLETLASMTAKYDKED